MATFLRGKQAGVQSDLSANTQAVHFAPEDQARYGINSQISCLAFDPVQSLLAVGTKETSYGPAKIYVFGANRVTRTLEKEEKRKNGQTHVVNLRFFGPGSSALLSIDSHSELSIWDLHTGSFVTRLLSPGTIAAINVDPSLDWAFLGLQMGDVLAYDLDRFCLSPFRIVNPWRQKNPHAINLRLVAVVLHPTDIGKLLLAYNHGVAIYNLKQGETAQYLEYMVPAGAPGGDGKVSMKERRPHVTHAAWHPSGTFILTAHDDGSLVFWDSSQGRILMARTLADTHVDRASGAQVPAIGHVIDGPDLRITKVAWCCKKDVNDTGVLIAGGTPNAGLTFLDLGPTPLFATSSWQVLTAHFEGKKQSTLPTPPGVAVTDFVLIPSESPHYAGGHDPVAVIALLSSGELVTLSFPGGHPVSPTNMLHPSLSMVHPFLSRARVNMVNRDRWLGMVEQRNHAEAFIIGGAQGMKPRKRGRDRSVIQVVHGDGTIRIWDLGHDDQIENPKQLQVDVASALARYDNINISAMDLASLTGEFVAGSSTGEVVFWRWGVNSNFLQSRSRGHPPVGPSIAGIADISARCESVLKEGLLPVFLCDVLQGPVSVVKVSNIGFVAAGSESGQLVVIDLRVSRVIHLSNTADFIKAERRSSILRQAGSSNGATRLKTWPTTIEFGVLTVDGDGYSSILCFVGTNQGHVLTFKLLPDGGGYRVELAGMQSTDGKVVAICPIVADTGESAIASPEVVAGLRQNKSVNGVLVVVTTREARIFKPTSSRGASKTFENYTVHSAVVSMRTELTGIASYVLVTVSDDCIARAFTLPGLREINKAELPMMDVALAPRSMITSEGDLVVWTSPTELAVLHVWGTGKKLGAIAGGAAVDNLVNPAICAAPGAVPKRPTISGLHWIAGTQYLSPDELDVLIWPDRPPRKGSNGEALPHSDASQNQTWGAYMMKLLDERGDRLNMLNDNMQNLTESTAKFAEDVGKMAKQQKRNMVLGGLKSKMGL